VKNRWAFSFLLFLSLWLPPAEGESSDRKDLPAGTSAPILLYHRLGPVVADSMTIPTSIFESHLKFLNDNGYKVIPLRELVDHYLRRKIPPNSRLLAITADDGHKSIYTEMFPLLKKYHIPITLFLYPSAISNASYALTWNEIREMKDTGLFDFQSHSYWHPNFKKEKERLNPADYERFAEMQFKKSKETLENRLDVKVDMLAWPFGIYDDWLMRKASEAGYAAAFTIERHCAGPSDPMMALPRFLLTEGDRGRVFERIVAGYLSMAKRKNDHE
jgi:peptidoglycan/xylan/chitin deacetylase (PgdA/CDA1 family)